MKDHGTMTPQQLTDTIRARYDQIGDVSRWVRKADLCGVLYRFLGVAKDMADDAGETARGVSLKKAMEWADRAAGAYLREDATTAEGALATSRGYAVQAGTGHPEINMGGC
jgi:hypothetical protein